MSESIRSIYPETRTPKPIGVGDVFQYNGHARYLPAEIQKHVSLVSVEDSERHDIGRPISASVQVKNTAALTLNEWQCLTYNWPGEFRRLGRITGVTYQSLA